MIFLAKGTCTLGHTTRDANGNVISHTDAKFEENEEGGSVIVGVLDGDTMEQVGDAEVYGDYDAYQYLKRTLELLKPSRLSNTPDFEDIFKKMYRNCELWGCPFEQHCDRLSCMTCVCYQWMDEENDDE